MTDRKTISIDAELFRQALDSLNNYVNNPSGASYAYGLLEAGRNLTPQVDDLLAAQASKWQEAVKDLEETAARLRSEVNCYKDAIDRSSTYIDIKRDGLHYVFCRVNPLPHQRVELD